VFGSTYFTCFYLKKIKAESKDPTQNSFFKAKQFCWLQNSQQVVLYFCWVLKNQNYGPATANRLDLRNFSSFIFLPRARRPLSRSLLLCESIAQGLEWSPHGDGRWAPEQRRVWPPLVPAHLLDSPRSKGTRGSYGVAAAGGTWGEASPAAAGHCWGTTPSSGVGVLHSPSDHLLLLNWG
jgi:hypothetical protein